MLTSKQLDILLKQSKHGTSTTFQPSQGLLSRIISKWSLCNHLDIWEIHCKHQIDSADQNAHSQSLMLSETKASLVRMQELKTSWTWWKRKMAVKLACSRLPKLATISWARTLKLPSKLWVDSLTVSSTMSGSQLWEATTNGTVKSQRKDGFQEINGDHPTLLTTKDNLKTNRYNFTTVIIYNKWIWIILVML